MRTTYVSLLALFMVIMATAQDKKQQDIDAIKSMCGCYEVTFNFTETFNYSSDSLYKPSATKVDKALEWAQLVTDDEDKIQIQHLLQVGDPSKPMIIKHWRQDWLYQNQELYTYDFDNKWNYEEKSEDQVQGQWTQKVYQVDDSPRYEGSATWVHVDGKSYWENTTPAPLARREYTTRSDYNMLLRDNRHEITNYGWLHEQDNSKVIKEEGKEDVLLAKEKGYNTYVKVDDSRCAAAANWWKEHSDKWELVRAKWNQVYNRDRDLTLENKVDNKTLYKFLFDENVDQADQIYTIIESFVKK
ncbi:hypothetical protein BST92_10855 [Nonlabens arenilitoris]|uniref:Uncharacterized protein n=1 Tax=Nonlabens arenilitoris TaxID=1217969 RepID=A0A2S7UDP3_9FLAO|nr:DUF6607 family protein [Nonlabens arenilitoris]PQJ32393.1 hypothetical protein BST92_10855 [Nonlabens arenilitoris]